MVRHLSYRLAARPDVGFTLIELMMVLSIGAVLTALATPMLLSYWDSWSLQAGARELASMINLGRQLAIATRTAVCVDLNGGSLRFRIGGCAGTVWTGSVTDAAGAMRLSDTTLLELSSNGRPVFTMLGAASPGATYTVRHARTQAARTVVVAGSGRVTVE